MQSKNFLLNTKDGIAVLQINRPEVRNAMNFECWDELGQFIDFAGREKEIKLIVITGVGEKAFVAGADIISLKGRTMLDALEGVAQGVLRKLYNCDKPTIAAVNGVAFGGGCELAMACDIRISTVNAKFALPELGLGILPGAGGTQRLSKLIGLGRAKEMILTGRAISSTEALQIGLVTKVVAQEDLMSEAVSTAKVILSKGPLAVRLAKKVIDASMCGNEDIGMLLELFGYGLSVVSEDRMEGVSAFLEKRPAQFKGE